MSNIIKGQRVRKESVLSLAQFQTNAVVSDYKDEEQTVTPKGDIKESTTNEAKERAFKIIEDANSEARRIINESKSQADEIILRAKQNSDSEAKQILEAAKARGYDEGYTNGKQESETLIAKANEIIEEANKEKQLIIEQAEPEMIEFIIGICKNVISEEIHLNPDVIKLLIRKTISKIPYDNSGIIIKVSPSNYEYVWENKEEIVGDYINHEEVEVAKDINLSDSDCIIETPFGNIECNVSKHFAEITRQMRLISGSNEGNV